METLKKAGVTENAQEVSEEVLAKINRLTRAPLSAEQVFTFKVRAADDQVDRDKERFTPECLSQLARLFVGKTVIFDHEWSAGKQAARIYDGETVTEDGVTKLLLHVYMLRSEKMQPTIDAINGGILREVSIGCAIKQSTCSICGESFYGCAHRKGEIYDGRTCHVDLSEPLDAYELSFVAVPAQRDAGVTKSADAPHAMTDAEKKKVLLRKRLELKNKLIKI